MSNYNSTRASQSPVGILAGGGTLPMEIAETLREQNRGVVFVVLEGEADELSARSDVTVRNWGQIGGIINTFKKSGCREVLIVGSVNRPDLLAIRPDTGFFRALMTIFKLIRAGGDDAVLRGVISYFDTMGLKVIGPADVAPKLLVKPGPLPGTKALSATDKESAQHGFDIITALSPYDVGQAVVIGENGIEAIEGAEGTDRMLERVARNRLPALQSGRSQAHGVLVKQPKTGQDLRVDLPAIGPRTIVRAVEANLAGIVAEANRVIALSRDELIERAIVADIAVAGINPNRAFLTDKDEQSPARPAGIPTYQARQIGRIRLSKIDAQDAERCAAVSATLEPFGVGRAVVAARGHVLSVEANEPIEAAIERTSQLRQWGSRRWQRRSGVVVLTAGREATPELIAIIANAGLAGFAVRPQKFAARLGGEAVTYADKHKIFAAELIASEPGETT